jgi:ATP-dependent Clp protease ATP-binding subunit ClpA
MLHARNENINDQFLGQDAIALVDQDGSGMRMPTAKDEPAIETRMGVIDEDADTGKDSGNESAEADSDSEDKKESMKQIQNALVGMNVSGQLKFMVFLRKIDISWTYRCCWITSH